MDLPCQKNIWGVPPAIRAAIAVDPVRCGVSRTETNDGGHPLRSLPVYQGNVGYCVEFDEEAKESIRSLAQDLKDRRMESLVDRICAICKQVRRENDRCGTGQECPEP
ncbi:transcriptional regulator [Methanoculleus sp.]|uniref:transcriptional regulator n=1 Tax=Methanoculleus sp. TaxID=90427 RepID=UPI0025D6E9F8|nr:transcriptional regulator [Methanoculleus sp.]MCK9318658.1 transcriptional regulator [Methanoculleus sp.]